VHILERISEHYEVQEVEDIGQTYIWCPESLVVECDACGKRTTLKRAQLISSGFDCECGKDNAASIREEVILQLIDEDYEAHHHPWRYWHTSEETAGMPTASKTTTPSWQQCEHHGPMIVDKVRGGYVSQCLVCERWGPIGRTPEKARHMLMSLDVGHYLWP
jgi:hypothetical protein